MEEIKISPAQLWCQEQHKEYRDSQVQELELCKCCNNFALKEELKEYEGMCIVCDMRFN